jgi:hypothetical protein
LNDDSLIILGNKESNKLDDVSDELTKLVNEGETCWLNKI